MPTQVPEVRIRVLGRFEVSIGDRPICIPYYRARALLVCLAVLRRPIRREWLAELLIDEGNRTVQLQQLRRMLHVLRKHLEPRQALIQSQGRDAIALAGPKLIIDLEQLQARLDACSEPVPDPPSCQALLALAPRPLLEEFPAINPAFDHWLETLRQETLLPMQESIRNCSQLFESRGAWTQALAYAQYRRALDPDDEATCRFNLRLLDRLYGPARALEEYERFRDRLRVELNTEPTPETLALIENISRRLQPGPDLAGHYPLAVLCCRLLPGTAMDGLRMAISDAISDAGGHVQAVHGAELFGNFGFPEPDEAASRRALACARHCARLGAAVGVNSGWAKVDATLGLADASGQLSIHAQRLAAHAAPGDVWTTDSLQSGKGIILPAQAHLPSLRAIKLPDAADETDAATEPPLVGRDRELKQLLDLWHATRHGHQALALVQGEAGIGKTRLVSALRQQLPHHTWLVLRCRHERRHSAHAPLLEMLRHEPRTASRAEVRQLLEQYQRERTGIESLLPGVPVTEFAARVLQTLSSEGPLVVVIEDLHWADAGTRSLLTRLIEAECPGLLVLATSRQNEPDWPWQLQLTLGALVAKSARALLDNLPGRRNRNDADVLQRAAGVPLFLQALALTEADVRLPASLRDLLCSRIATLGQNRTLVEIAALLDEPFETSLIAAVLGKTTDAGLVAAQRAAILTTDADGQWRFRHPLMRDATLDALGGASRTQLHRRILEALEQPPHPAQPDQLARHAAGAGLLDRARRYHLLAARQAADLAVYPLAEHHLGKALVNLSADEDQVAELEIRLLQGQILAPLHGYGAPQAREAWERARALAAPLGDEPQLFRLFWGLWLGASSWWDYSVADDLAVRLRSMAEQSGEAALVSAADYALGNVRLCRGHLQQAIGYLNAAPLPDPVPDALGLGEEPGVAALSFLSWALWISGDPTAAGDASRRALQRARETAHPPSLCFALILAAVLERYQRAPARVAAHAEEARSLAEHYGLTLWKVAAELMLGWCAAAEGNPSGLAEMTRTVAAIGEVMGGVRAMFLANLADACEQAGAWEEAINVTKDGLAECQRRGDVHEQAEFERIHACACAALGRSAEAELWFSRAAETARAQDAWGFLARIENRNQ